MPVNRALHSGQQGRLVERLQDIRDDAVAKRGVRWQQILACREHYRGVRVSFTNLTREPESVVSRHANIAEDDLCGMRPKHFEGRGSILGLQDLMLRGFQPPPQHIAEAC